MIQFRLKSGQLVTVEHSGFVQCAIKIRYPEQDYAVWSPEVVSRGLANEMLEMLTPAFPACELSIERFTRAAEDLPAALQESDRVLAIVLAVRGSDHPGQDLIKQTGLFHSAPRPEQRV
ncbi:hypothetical protein [Stutzerimonas azotifigens]|uniref:hypothetical protein n=1 Tax=Stutzerimonas azotifigens TaxID=291995 RepID=UPI0004829CFE|nr:hypothetical protein [Stutzerimonas azotifigens]